MLTMIRHMIRQLENLPSHCTFTPQKLIALLETHLTKLFLMNILFTNGVANWMHLLALLSKVNNKGQ